jgi:hypothetical protein
MMVQHCPRGVQSIISGVHQYQCTGDNEGIGGFFRVPLTTVPSRRPAGAYDA